MAYGFDNRSIKQGAERMVKIIKKNMSSVALDIKKLFRELGGLFGCEHIFDATCKIAE